MSRSPLFYFLDPPLQCVDRAMSMRPTSSCIPKTFSDLALARAHKMHCLHVINSRFIGQGRSSSKHRQETENIRSLPVHFVYHTLHREVIQMSIAVRTMVNGSPTNSRFEEPWVADCVDPCSWCPKTYRWLAFPYGLLSVLGNASLIAWDSKRVEISVRKVSCQFIMNHWKFHLCWWANNFFQPLCCFWLSHVGIKWPVSS